MPDEVAAHSSPVVEGTTRLPAGNSLTVAIMQPYFIPYAGYFRLFAASDIFVIYDCVQFPRRGWVHRNRVADGQGRERWLTLPLEKGPRDILIRDLRFAPGAGRVLADRLRPLALQAPDIKELGPVLDALHDVSGTPVDYIERLLRQIVSYLGFQWTSVRSSALGIPPSLRGQDRILEIARRMGASRYLNSPGGRALYDPEIFAAAGIELEFLPDYSGPFTSILTRIVSEDRQTLARDVRSAI
jgi:hypothetical protein